MSTELLIVIASLLLTALVRFLSNKRCAALEQQVDDLHDDVDARRRRELELERELHDAKCRLAALGAEEEERCCDEQEEVGALSRR